MNRRKFVMSASGLLVPLLVESAQPLLINRRSLFVAKSSSWVPTQLTGLQWGIRASDESLSDGNAVGTATDRSGNGRNFTQGTAANKPTFKTSIINGKAVYRFDGNDLMSQTAFTIGTTQAVTIFAVIKWSVNVATNGDIVLERGNPFFSNQGGLILGDSGNAKLNSGGEGNGGASTFENNTALGTTNFHKIIARLNFSLASHEATSTVDAGTAGTWTNDNNNTLDFNQSLGFWIGGRGDASNPFTGDIAEIWVTNQINAGDETSWISYVSTQYGI